jgi:hypothetical protein
MICGDSLKCRPITIAVLSSQDRSGGLVGFIPCPDLLVSGRRVVWIRNCAPYRDIVTVEYAMGWEPRVFTKSNMK